jgi:hypothetical protein
MVTLSTAEAKLAAGTQCAEERLYMMRLLESIGLKVQKPMILEIDNKGTNKGTVDLANNWSVGGRTRHVEVAETIFSTRLEGRKCRIEVKEVSILDCELYK